MYIKNNMKKIDFIFLYPILQKGGGRSELMGHVPYKVNFFAGLPNLKRTSMAMKNVWKLLFRWIFVSSYGTKYYNLKDHWTKASLYGELFRLFINHIGTISTPAVLETWNKSVPALQIFYNVTFCWMHWNSPGNKEKEKT